MLRGRSLGPMLMHAVLFPSSPRWLRFGRAPLGSVGLAGRNAATVIGIFLLAIATSPRSLNGSILFLSPGNLTDALRAMVPVAVVSLAMTLVILTGGIDLSVGSITALSGVISARVLTEWHPAAGIGIHMATAIALGILSGVMVGLLNGALIASLRIQAFIVTLASMIGIRGLALWTANNERIGLGVGRDAGGYFGEWIAGKGLMVGTWLVLAFGVLLVLNRTVFGRHLRALGDNPTAAHLAGLPVNRILIGVYGLSGLMAGVAGVLLAARTTTGDPNAGMALELDAIAVVVIGGASLAGGRGGIFGTLCGALIIGMVTNLLGLRNVGSNAQLILKAVIIVVSVAMQRSQNRH